jgi:CheY-like chemotaxis protein
MTRARGATGSTTAAPPGRPLILLVDDFADNREMYAEFLAFAGLEVAEAASGNEALDQAFTLQPDLIVMDLSLPGLDGYEATRRLKDDARTRRIPVIALTGHALAGHSKSAFDAGCDAFVTKPCLPEHLLQEIQGMLDRTTTQSNPGR